MRRSPRRTGRRSARPALSGWAGPWAGGGGRLEILARLAGQAGAGRDPLELRDEAVACLGDLDFEEVARFEGGRGAIRALAFGADGATLATLSEDGTLQVWDVRDVRALRSVTTPRSPVFSPAPRFRYECGAGPLGFLTTEGAIQWLGAVAPPPVDLPGPVRAFDIDRAGRRMAVLAADGYARVYRLADGELLLEQPYRGEALALVPDGSRLATIAPEGFVRLSEVDGEHAVTQLDRLVIDCKKLAFSPDGALLASGDNDGAIRVWDMDAGWVQQVDAAAHETRPSSACRSVLRRAAGWRPAPTT